jgi:hypothetical protein
VTTASEAQFAAYVEAPAIERRGAIEAWIIDDTGFPKKEAAFGGRGAAVLRTARQAGQL